MQEMDAHLEVCQECAQEWKSLRDLGTALAGWARWKSRRTCRCAFASRLARSARAVTAASLPCGIWCGETAWGRFCCRPARALPVPCCCWALSFFWFPCLPSRRWRRLLRRAVGQCHRAAFALFFQCAGSDETGAIDGPVVVEVCINPAGEVYDYRIVSGRRTPPRALKSRTCCCLAALRRPGSSASRCADWPYCRSPACPCGDKRAGTEGLGTKGLRGSCQFSPSTKTGCRPERGRRCA